MIGTTFFICSTSAISALSLLYQEFPLEQLQQKDGEKDARTKRRKQDCGEIQADGDDPGHFCLYKFFICKQSDCVENHGDTHSFKSTDCILRETWRKIKSKFQSRRSVEFSRTAKGCSTGHKHRGTCRNLQTRRISRKPLKLQMIQKIRNPKVEFGHINSIFHHIVLITWRRYSRS